MHTQNDSGRTCPHCAAALPDAARLCANCGASVPPLPVLVGKPNRERAAPFLHWTGSKRGDIAAGVALGIGVPVAVAVLCYFGYFALLYPWWHHGDIFQYAAMLLAVILPFTLPFIFANVLKHKHFVAGDAMQKMLWGWLILLGLSLLGAFVMCFAGQLRLH